MPIETPKLAASTSNKGISSEFVLCEDFAFRPTTVDGFSHQTFPDGSAITTINFKAYTQSIPDPTRRLFNYLVKEIQPHPVDETS